MLGLMVLAVAATTTGVALASNTAPNQDNTFGRANTMITFSAYDQPGIDAARAAFGTIEVITHQSIAIRGTSDTYDLRGEVANGVYSAPLLRLDRGRLPHGTNEIAITADLASRLGLHFGGPMTVDGRTRRIVGIVENPLQLNDAFALVAPGQVTQPDQVTLLANTTNQQMSRFRPSADVVGIGQQSLASKDKVAVAVLALETIGLLFVGLVAAAGFMVMAQRR